VGRPPEIAFWGFCEMSLDLRDPQYWLDPYPTLDEARARGRTTATHDGEVALLRADDIDQVHMDPHFAVPGLSNLERLGIFDGPFYEWRSQAMAVLEGADHKRLRGFVGLAFAPSQMARLRGMVRERANELIDRRAGDSEMEVLADFASDLPLWSMCRFVGIDDEDRERISQFLFGTEEGFSSPMTPERRARCEASIVALNAYVAELIERRRARPHDDVVSMIIAEQEKPDGPTDRELVSLLVNIIGGSVGSTRAAFANTILEFARHPDQADRVRAEPDLAPQAVEEGLRFHPPFRFGRRVVARPVQMFGLDLAEGQSIYIPRAAYNRDPARFRDPHRFDVGRPAQRHLSFGFGSHFCLGQAVARTNLQEGLNVFLGRCLKLELVSEPVRIPFTVDEQLEALHVRFNAIIPAL
jgi:cytochrome P450